MKKDIIPEFSGKTIHTAVIVNDEDIVLSFNDGTRYAIRIGTRQEFFDYPLSLYVEEYDASAAYSELNSQNKQA